MLAIYRGRATFTVGEQRLPWGSHAYRGWAMLTVAEPWLPWENHTYSGRATNTVAESRLPWENHAYRGGATLIPCERHASPEDDRLDRSETTDSQKTGKTQGHTCPNTLQRLVAQRTMLIIWQRRRTILIIFIKVNVSRSCPCSWKDR